MWSVSITSTAYYGNSYQFLNRKLHARLWANGPQALGQWATSLSQWATTRGTMKSGLSHQAAAELSSKLFRDCSAGETPQQEIAIIFVSVPDVRNLNAALIVKRVHRIEPFPKATRRHADFDDKRKAAGDGQIPTLQRREKPDISLRIHASIRRQLKAGAIDAHTIAFTALKDVLVPDTP
jgi:hypothetical protein